jgi:hypothetical protein
MKGPSAQNAQPLTRPAFASSPAAKFATSEKVCVYFENLQTLVGSQNTRKRRPLTPEGALAT